MNKILKITFYISITFQILSILITYQGMFKKLSNDDKPLKNSLIIENIVQYIEFIFYLIMIYSLNSIKLNLITPTRYIDWVITTPLMLLSTLIFMEYDKSKNNNDKQLSFLEFIKKYKIPLIKILVFNLLMLLFGYLGEINIIKKYISIPIGFGFFSLVFYIIYKNFYNESNKKLFYFVISIWSLYGVSATLPNIPKNISYNFLDIISKNLYAIFIYYKILNVNNYN